MSSRLVGNVALLPLAAAALLLGGARPAEGLGAGGSQRASALAAAGVPGAASVVMSDGKPKLKVRGVGRNADEEGNETGEEKHPINAGMRVLKRLDPFSDDYVQTERFACGQTTKVSSRNHGLDRCPGECPFFVQDKTDQEWCSFKCVPAEQCTWYNPETNIADPELRICRKCMVDHCVACDTTTKEDRCKTCSSMYYVDANGQCSFVYAKAFSVLLFSLGVLFVYAAAWLIDMAWRPVSNAKELDHAQAARERSKIHTEPDAEGHRKLFPWGTNLHRTSVAGPGMILHFNFQAAIILWAIFVALAWMCFCKNVDSDLWFLGTRKYGTPRQNCILVAWGYETQHRLMWATVSFLWIAYLSTCFLCFAYSVGQLRCWQDFDAKTTTMKDFAAMLVGVGGLPAGRRLEEELKEGVEGALGQKVIGVSVAWNYSESIETVQGALRKDLDDLMEANSVEQSPPAEVPEYGALRGFLHRIEQEAFGLPSPDDAEKPLDDEAITSLIMGMHSSPRAVVVFDTEDARDTALEKAEGGFDIPGVGAVTLEEVMAEPDSVNWENFGRDADHHKVRRIVTGFGVIGLACAFWAIVFYGPYAYYALTFDYSNGREPGIVVGFAFSMVVVVGNAIMYEVCARISDWVGFRFRDQREACYLVLYTVACLFNVVLDFVTTYIIQEIVLEAMGFRTYFGQPISEVTTFTEKFQTYGMQRALAENTWTYAFPSTFLIPFLIEWGPTMLVPWYVGRLIVKNHPEVRGLDAEDWLAMLPMDMGRYADILLNTILGIFIFFFPSGYTWTLFLTMTGSHVFIYFFDYYKVLRQIPTVDYVAYDIEWWAQATFAPIVAIMASALVFKGNCEPGYHCVQGNYLLGLCALAWLAHTLLHIAVLNLVVPRLGRVRQKHPQLEVPYWNIASHNPSSWFASNPVNCLRSKYFYKHSPPCDYYWPGKEALLRENEGIGCHFTRSTAGFRLSSVPSAGV